MLGLPALLESFQGFTKPENVENPCQGSMEHAVNFCDKWGNSIYFKIITGGYSA